VTDPRIIMRRSRMRRIFTWVMAGAVALLALAGVCSLARRPDTQVASPAKVAEPSPPPVNAAAVAPVAEPVPAEPAAAPAAAQPQVPPASAAASKTPAPQTYRTKAVPRKTHSAHSP
jgi:hypothetical protein